MRKIVSIKKVRFSEELNQIIEIPNNIEIHESQVDYERKQGGFELRKRPSSDKLKENWYMFKQ